MKQFVGNLCIDAIKLNNLQQHSCAITKNKIKQIEKKYLMAVVPYYEIDKLKENNIVSEDAQESMLHKSVSERSVEIISALMCSSVKVKEHWLPEGMTKEDVIDISNQIKRSFSSDKLMSSIYFWIKTETMQEDVEVMKIDCLERYKKMIKDHKYEKCNYITGSSYPDCLWIMLIPLRSDSLVSLKIIHDILTDRSGFVIKEKEIFVKYKKASEGLWQIQEQSHKKGNAMDCEEFIEEITKYYKTCQTDFEDQLDSYLVKKEIPDTLFNLYIRNYFLDKYNNRVQQNIKEMQNRCEDLYMFEDSDED